MGNSNRHSSTSQCRVAKYAENVDAHRFFNLLTGPELLEVVEATLPEHRERHYPPTMTLSMFLGQAMSADSSCQNAVIESAVSRQAMGLRAGSVSTGGYCLARQRLPQEMVSTRASRTGEWRGEHTPESWVWMGREG